jgi:acyl-coenzyme A thioesterase PaaI-like protein
LRLVFERDADTVACTYTAPRELASYGRLLHGGVTSTLLDEAMAWAVYGLLDKLPLTTELHVRLLGSIHTGEPLSLRGSIVSSDGRYAQARAELRDAAGTLCAESEGRLRFVSAAAVERLSRTG